MKKEKEYVAQIEELHKELYRRQLRIENLLMDNKELMDENKKIKAKNNRLMIKKKKNKLISQLIELCRRKGENNG